MPQEEAVSNLGLGKYIDDYHCPKMKKLKLDRMCTSVAIGFYLRTEEDFLAFKCKIKALAITEHSIFTVYD